MLGVIPALLVACVPSATRRAVGELGERVAQLAQEVRRQRRVVEELNNRLFILQDRVDANRVVLGRRSAGRRALLARPAPRPVPRRAARPAPTPGNGALDRARRRLPVVRLRAGGRAQLAAGRRASGKRIVLRLTGPPRLPTSQGGHGSRGAPPVVSERLPVVPLPRAPATAATSGSTSEYQEAQRLLRKGSLKAAAQAFSGFARRYPRHDYADNALYWLAECLYRQGKAPQAIWVLRRLLKQYPSGNKAPSALLKLAYCHGRLGRPRRARQVLGQVIKLYPGTREARLAASRLGRAK